MRLLGICLLLVWPAVVPLQLSGQDFVPKREFRAAWVATLTNIDWPSRKGLTPQQQQAEFIRILDTLRSSHMNAVIVQVRPKGDAFYRSATEPWSEYLSGAQGTDPGYDPLAFMVQAAHERGMELHAWLNPFRVTVGEDLSKLSPQNVGRRHPEWLIRYEGRYYLDPGLYEVRKYLLSVVAELARDYDIDAIHMDDYFYPYPQGGKPFPDEKSYRKYGATLFGDAAQWRRDNVNQLIKGLSDTIRAVRPGLKFGISPFGIYRNVADDPKGSNTRGLSNYDDLYADVVLWAREGWIDYVLPQLYWENGHPSADFGELLQWWSKHHYKAQLYVGHGVYNISAGSNKPVWRTPGEICRQVDMQRLNPSSAGSAFYSVKYLVNNTRGISDSLRERYYCYMSLTPAMPQVDSRLPLPAANVRMGVAKRGVRVSWEPGDREGLVETDVPSPVRYYAVYRFGAGEMVNINDVSHLLARVWANGPLEYTDQAAGKGKWVYVVTSVSASGMENEDFSVAAPAPL